MKKRKNTNNPLQRKELSKMCPFKVCVVGGTRKILRKIMGNEIHYCEAGEKRCGYVSFFYFDKLKLALQLRNKLYHRKDLYVFLQDDRNIL